MARQWAVQRRLVYGGSVLAVILAVVSVPAYFIWFDHTPTCSDGIRNQGEVGADCGGPCGRLCSKQTVSPNVLWSRAFKVSDGIYNVVAYIENPNFEAGVRDVSYTFSLRDDENVLVAERSGTTFISPRMTFPIFEATVKTGNREPARTLFSFTETPTWHRMDDTNQQALEVQQRTLEAPQSSPKLRARIANTQVSPISNITVTAVVFDTQGNAMASSQTRIDQLQGDADRTITLTWPDAFPRTVGRIDVIPRAELSQAQ